MPGRFQTCLHGERERERGGESGGGGRCGDRRGVYGARRLRRRFGRGELGVLDVGEGVGDACGSSQGADNTLHDLPILGLSACAWQITNRCALPRYAWGKIHVASYM